MPTRVISTVLVAVLLTMPTWAFGAKPPPPPPANPVVTSVSSFGEPVGTQVTITGTGFGPKKESNYPMFGGVRGSVVSWSDTQIVTSVPNRAEAGYVGVMVDGVISNGFYFVPGVKPVVTGISQRGAPVGTEITFTGYDFGATQGIGWVTIAGVSADVVSWSDTQVVARVPAGAGAGYIGIWQNAICSNGLWFVPGGVPQIDAVSKNPALVGDIVTVSGQHFGSITPTSTLTLGTREISPISWTDTAISFRVPDDASSGYLGVGHSGVVSNGLMLGVGGRITGLSDWWGAPGTQLTITGVGFGSTADRVTIGGVDCPIVSWSPTTIVVTIPSGAPEGEVGVWRDGIASNGMWFLPDFRPNITSVNPVPARPGDTVTVNGLHFGTAPEGSGALTLGGVAITPTSWSDTAVTFVMPDDGVSDYVGISRKGLSSNGFLMRVGPKIDAISGWWGEPGSQLTIDGRGFGTDTERVTLGTTELAVVSWTNTRIVATVPSATLEGDIGVWNNNEASNGMHFLAAYRPHIDSVAPLNAAEGETVTIKGTHFGDAPTGAAALTLGGVAITPASWTDTEITFVVPDGAQSGYVGIDLKGLTSNGVMLPIGPRITSLSGWWGEPGTQLTINGVGFGTTADRVTMGGVDCPVVSWTATQIVVTIPEGAPEGYVGVWRGSTVSNGIWFLPMHPAQITDVSPGSGPSTTTVTITGSYFGATQGDSKVTLGGAELTVVSWSDTQIVATLPAGASSGYIGVWKHGIASNGRWFDVTP